MSKYSRLRDMLYGALALIVLTVSITFVIGGTQVTDSVINMTGNISAYQVNVTVAIINGTVFSGDTDTVWPLTGKVLFNNSGSLDANMTYLNATMDVRDSDTTYSESDKYLTLVAEVFGIDESVLNATIRAIDTNVSNCTNCLGGQQIDEAGLTCASITGDAGLCDSDDADTQLTENQVEAYIFDSDNTANLGLGGYNITQINYVIVNVTCFDSDCNQSIIENATGSLCIGDCSDW